jgi:hypothetical protein
MSIYTKVRNAAFAAVAAIPAMGQAPKAANAADLGQQPNQGCSNPEFDENCQPVRPPHINTKVEGYIGLGVSMAGKHTQGDGEIGIRRVRRLESDPSLSTVIGVEISGSPLDSNTVTETVDSPVKPYKYQYKDTETDSFGFHLGAGLRKQFGPDDRIYVQGMGRIGYSQRDGSIPSATLDAKGSTVLKGQTYDYSLNGMDVGVEGTLGYKLTPNAAVEGYVSYDKFVTGDTKADGDTRIGARAVISGDWLSVDPTGWFSK